jgi:hypothetical protein
MEKGGVCIFVHKSLNFLSINLSRYCEDQDIEVCALKLESVFLNICVLAVYRAPGGNFSSFLSRLDKQKKKTNSVALSPRANYTD